MQSIHTNEMLLDHWNVAETFRPTNDSYISLRFSGKHLPVVVAAFTGVPRTQQSTYVASNHYFPVHSHRREISRAWNGHFRHYNINSIRSEKLLSDSAGKRSRTPNRRARRNSRGRPFPGAAGRRKTPMKIRTPSVTICRAVYAPLRQRPLYKNAVSSRRTQLRRSCGVYAPWFFICELPMRVQSLIKKLEAPQFAFATVYSVTIALEVLNVIQ